MSVFYEWDVETVSVVDDLVIDHDHRGNFKACKIEDTRRSSCWCVMMTTAEAGRTSKMASCQHTSGMHMAALWREYRSGSCVR
jgi:hypothetical protein